jgi:cell division protein FtsW
MEQVFSKLKGDKWIWIIVIILSGWSLLAVYSSVGTLAYKEGKGTEMYLVKHFLIIAVGLILMYLSHKLDYRYYAGISKLLMIITIPLLLYTLIFGNTVNDASRWVTIPVINQTFQTSDLAKLALITFLARMLSRKQEEIKDVKKILRTYHGSSVRRIRIDRMGQFIDSINAIRSQCIIVIDRTYQLSPNRGRMRCRCSTIAIGHLFGTPPCHVC